jgi:hypothetical protein
MGDYAPRKDLSKTPEEKLIFRFRFSFRFLTLVSEMQPLTYFAGIVRGITKKASTWLTKRSLVCTTIVFIDGSVKFVTLRLST